MGSKELIHTVGGLLMLGSIIPAHPVQAGQLRSNDCPLPQAPANFRVEEWRDRLDGMMKEVVIKWDTQEGDLGYYFELDDYRTRYKDITIPDHRYNSILLLLKGDTIYGASVFARNSCEWGPEATLAVAYYQAS